MAKQEDSGHSFLAYFKRATSPLAVLRILSDRPMYGYELIQELKQRSGGKYQLFLLYPVLYRLEEQGYFQERTLSALNEAITLQQRQLDDLQGRMEAVEEKFRELWELVGNEGGEATVPPHYMKLA